MYVVSMKRHNREWETYKKKGWPVALENNQPVMKCPSLRHCRTVSQVSTPW